MEYKRVLMLRFTNGMSSREIAETTGDGKTMVNEFLKRFRECTELSYLLPEEVHQRVYRERPVQKSRESGQFRSVQVLRRGRNAPCPDQKRETFKHLWKKYNVAGTMNGRRPLSYRQFRRRYTNWLDSKKVTFQIQRVPGVNLELDFTGKTLSLHDRHNTGLITPVTIFFVKHA